MEVGALEGSGQSGDGTDSGLPWMAPSILCLFGCVTVGSFSPSLALEPLSAHRGEGQSHFPARSWPRLLSPTL